jgi:hypothetical protein
MKFLSVLSVLGLVSCPICFAAPQMGPGGSAGGDNVEPLFIKAQKDAVQIVDAIKSDKIDQLPINPPYQTWLSTGDHLSKLQFYVEAIKLSFQDAPCNEGGAPRSTSFGYSASGQPQMCVSRSYNRSTTPDQAKALVIHEAGHFTGEMDHIFLSELGVELVSQELAKPKLFTEDCDVGYLGGADNDDNVYYRADNDGEKRCKMAAIADCITAGICP